MGALSDITVVDVTTSFWASVGTALLADFGADVRWIDQGRGEFEMPEWDQLLARRNKTTVALNLDTDEGAEKLFQMTSGADVFVTDLPLNEVDSRRLDYEQLTALKRDLIYVYASGFGPEGPDRDLPALDELAAARTGMMPILPQPGEPPVYPGSGQMYSSVMLALGVMLAVHHRAETGEGQRVDVSVFGGNMYGASLDIQAYLAIGGERFLRPLSRLDAGNPMSGPSYPASDGRWVTLTMPDTDRYWPRFAPIVGLDPSDPSFDSHEKRCEENRLELIAHLDAAFRQQPSAHWKERILELGLSADVIEAYDYPVNDEEARRNRYVIEVEGAAGRKTDSLGFPVHMSESPATLRAGTQAMAR